MGAGFLLLMLVFVGFAAWMSQQRRNTFEAELIQAVQERGGKVMRVDWPWFRSGPWFFRGKGRQIVKLVYTDAGGNFRQVWGRTGLFGNDVDWDYDDGDYGGF